MASFRNRVILRGFLGDDARIAGADKSSDGAHAVLLLATASGAWKLSTNEWSPRIDWHRVICPGPRLCRFTRGMRRGEYLEIEGELRTLEQERGIVIAGERFPVNRTTYAVHAIRIQRLERPDALVDSGDGS